jgi:hypothetical protein
LDLQHMLVWQHGDHGVHVCWDAAVGTEFGDVLGQPHVDRCDVARCLVTGLQRIGCDAVHDCGTDTWSGRWPGEAFPVKSAC